MTYMDETGEMLPKIKTTEMHRSRDLRDYGEEFGLTEQEFIDWLNKFSVVGDMGSGEGKLIESAQNNQNVKAKIVGVDFDPRGGEGTVAQARFEHLPFMDNSLDAAISSKAAMYYAEDAESLERQAKELYRVIKPGGELIITMMSGESPRNAEEALKTNYFFVSAPDRSGFISKKSADILKNQGFVETERKVSKNDIHTIALSFKKE